MNGDGIDDIISTGYDGRVYVIYGRTDITDIPAIETMSANQGYYIDMEMSIEE